nr:MAG TPA: hypothetical protein [Caudoviricetes sp.]
MAYIVTTNIVDTKDNNRLYEKGEVYPRLDLNVSDARIKALLKKGVIESNGAPGDIVLPKTELVEEIEEEAGE